jgi:toxin ParE1/3/4
VWLRWSPAAEADLLQIWAYLAREASPLRADAQIMSIKQTAERLREWPHSGRSCDELILGLRSVVVAPHVIFYRVLGDSVQIARVLHGRRDINAVFTDMA